MLRDKYVAGKLFNVNDDVVTLEGVEGKINKLGSNHVEVKLKGDGRFKNFWLSDICLNNQENIMNKAALKNLLKQLKEFKNQLKEELFPKK